MKKYLFAICPFLLSGYLAENISKDNPPKEIKEDLPRNLPGKGSVPQNTSEAPLSWDALVAKQPSSEEYKALGPASNAQEQMLTELSLLGHHRAQMELASHYYAGTGGIPQSYRKAFYWLSKLVEETLDPVALNNAGGMLKNGQGCTKDLAKAFEYFKKAVERLAIHPAPAMAAYFNLSAMHYGGKGTAKDPQAALNTFVQGIRACPPLIVLFEALYTLAHKQDFAAFLMKERKDAQSAKPAYAAFEVFKSLIERGEKQEEDLLQLITDYSQNADENAISVAQIRGFMTRAMAILNLPASPQEKEEKPLPEKNLKEEKK